MRSATGPLPSSLSAPRVSARLWISLAAGVGVGVCAYAGLYPRFDDGALRLVIALTGAPFAAAVVATSLVARTATGAFGRAVGFSAILGIAATIVPAALLAHNEFFFAAIMGAIFGAPTGALYGLPLGVLAALGYRHVRAQTHESTDRAARVGGGWLVVISAFGLVGTLLLDEAKMDWGTQLLTRPSPLPAVVAVAAAIAGIVVVVRAFTRLADRSAWIERVRSGLEPAFRLRAIDVRDRVEGLPRLSNGAAAEATVVEWIPDVISELAAGTAYRVTATGTAVAIVSDEAPLTI